MTIQISKHKDSDDEYSIFNADDMRARGRALIRGYEVINEFEPSRKVELPADTNRNDLIALLELHQTDYASRLEIADKFALKGITDILEELYATSTE